ncbi:hypothetical protein [Ensifer soli]|uniref:hypothetical protein n=1 Tax=Ciceribacter sp. sgz301302 TaxID=3342379 RepID=UPI0035B9102C
MQAPFARRMMLLAEDEAALGGEAGGGGRNWTLILTFGIIGVVMLATVASILYSAYLLAGILFGFL